MKGCNALMFKCVLKVSLCLLAFSSFAVSYDIKPETDLVGRVFEANSHLGETLLEVGRRYDIGAYQIVAANPHLDKKKPLNVGSKVIIPAQFILPNIEREGIIINLAEQRMYYFPSNEQMVITEPVGIGRKGEWQTPVGVTKITKKDINPNWYPTASVRREAAKHGTPIPWKFPPGPNNPIGKYIFRLGWNAYLIHGTNQTESVGGQVSAGCIRMLPEGIERIFDKVDVGTKVTVINEPIKIGWQENKLFIESHNFSTIGSDKKEVSIVEMLIKKIQSKPALISWKKVKEYTQMRLGYPQVIGNL